MTVKILLADKSITIQKVVEMLFSGRDYEVTSVSDGETALSEAARVVPDVVLADVDLPRLDGYALSGKLKQTPLLAQTPVILMMSRDDVYDSTKGMLAGIVDNIAKPFESQELIGKVKKALAAAPPKPVGPEKPAVVPQSATPAASPTVAEPYAARSVQNSSTDIFDIIQEAPTESEIKNAASPVVPDEESVYEVEPEVEEVLEPLAQEIPQAFPVGDKAVEEMRAGLGLTNQTMNIAPEIIPYESFEIAIEKEAKGEVSTPPNEAAAVSSTLTAGELRKIAEDTIAKMAKDVFAQMPPVQPPTLSEGEIRRMAEAAISERTKEVFAKIPSPQLPALSASELWGIAEETITKMAKDVFAQIPPVQPPKISDELVRSVIEEAAAKMVKEALEIKPPQIPEDMLRRMVEENVLKVVNETIEKAAIPNPPILPESELRRMAETTLDRMASDIFKNMPTPPLPKISDEAVRSGLESVLSQIAREMAKEVIEQVSWEVIPQLAEHLIKEEIERLKAEK